MCGIAGVFDVAGGAASSGALAEIADHMAATLRHRGPDDFGRWHDPDGVVAMGHRRLAILDPSDLGHQPMHSSTGRYVISYNGEIYNFRALRQELAGANGFRGGSDTEVLLAAVETWGLQRTLTRVNGMFGFALWDRHQRELHLARDPLGEKPLYYTWLGTQLVFGSELKALRAHPEFALPESRAALTLLLRHGFIPAPYSIHEDVWKIPPGHVLTVPAGSSANRGEIRPYWSLREVALRGQAEPFIGSSDEAVAELTRLLEASVRGRLESDVPLGAFLSGGVDSSTVVALAQSQASRPVKTFTVAMDDQRLDEAADARAVAKHLGTDHHEVLCTSSDALDLVPSLAAMYDEPFADPSQIPTALISRVARDHVTVCLSGDGGDEVFGGYNRYVLGALAWRWMRRAPLGARRAASRALFAAGPETWDRVGGFVDRLLPAAARQRSYGVKAHKLAKLLTVDSHQELYLRLISHWSDPTAVAINAAEPPTVITDMAAWPDLPDVTAQLLFVDGVTTLPDDMLVKVDRASMATSLETRLPLLDPAVVEFSWRLPMDLKIRRGAGKWILRQVLNQFVPAELVERPKTGFDPPLGEWLRGPLRDWAEDLLSPRQLGDQGFLDPHAVRMCWDEHLSGRRNNDYALWAVLMFQAYLDSKAEVPAR